MEAELILVFKKLGHGGEVIGSYLEREQSPRTEFCCMVQKFHAGKT